MDLRTIKETDIWTLYEQGVSFCRLTGMYSDTDLNHRMFGGDQWHGLKVSGIEKVQYNIIKPIVRYKTSVVLSNLYAIKYVSENYESREFQKVAEKICTMLNKKVAKIWEKDWMDLKLRVTVKDAAINDEGILYVDYDSEKKQPKCELLDKNDVLYGDENNYDIEKQPYILVKQRMPVSEVQEIARANGVSEAYIDMIIGDLDNIEEAGESAKYEKDNKCTLVTKMYIEKGKVHFAQATRYVDIKKDTNSGLTRYPLTHVIWEVKKGSARGEGEVTQLIPNQLEINKTAMRRALSVKNTAYPYKVINEKMIKNPGAVERSGSTIKTDDRSVDDVAKIIRFITPSQMSPDAEKFQNELIQTTRELAGAGEVATGQINPEQASGRAILAIQQATQQPLTEHLAFTKKGVEDLGRIFLDQLIAYEEDVMLEDVVTDQFGQEHIQLVKVPRVTLEALKANVKVEVTPKGAYDKYAQEQSIENLLKGGFLSHDRIPELKLYAMALDDDSVMPKQKLLQMIEDYEAEQRKIMEINMRVQTMSQNVQEFLMRGPDAQAQQMVNAQKEIQTQQPQQELLEENEEIDDI